MPEQLQAPQGNLQPSEPGDMEKRIALAKQRAKKGERLGNIIAGITLLLAVLAVLYELYSLAAFLSTR